MANNMSRLAIMVLAFFVAQTVFAEKKISGIQKRSLIVKDGFFYPDKLVIFDNEALHLMVGNFMGHSTCMANENLRFFINVSPGDVVEQQVYFKGQGEYKFSCPGLKSDLTVIIKPKPILDKKKMVGIARLPASVPDGVWVPKNESSSETGGW